jgi:CRP/FNR family transcriptional regulator, cyclic AMP receptor protein
MYQPYQIQHLGHFVMLPVISAKPDQIIFEEGQNDHRMFILLEGSVRLYVTRNGKEIDLELIDKFHFFGEIEMFQKKPRTLSAKAVTNARMAVIKTRMQLEQFMSEHPKFPGKMTRMMGQRLAQAERSIALGV